MYFIKQTEEFVAWMKRLKDLRAFALINKRIKRAEEGNLGDFKSVGDKIFELRISYGPGYRVYYTLRNKELILLLIAGDKSTQAKDIATARLLAAEYGAKQ